MMKSPKVVSMGSGGDMAATEDSVRKVLKSADYLEVWLSSTTGAVDCMV